MEPNTTPQDPSVTPPSAVPTAPVSIIPNGELAQPTITTPTVISPTTPAISISSAVDPTGVSTAPSTVTPLVSPAPSVFSGGAVVGMAGPEPVMDGAKKRFPKAALIGFAGLVIVGLAGAGYYFGYYTNSSVVYSQALGNTGKGITELSNRLTEQPKLAYKGYTGSGSYKVESDSFKTDGKMNFRADSSNSDTTFDVGLGTGRLNVDFRTIKSVSTNPDIYLKASGLESLGSLLGPNFSSITSKYGDKWIVVDHTLLDNVEKQTVASAATVPPSSEQMVDELSAFNKVNQQYVFTANKDKAVTVILKSYGRETVDGHQVMHYKVGLNKTHVKTYVTAQRDALKASKLQAWIVKNNYQDAVDSAYKDAIKSSDNIKSDDTFEMYADVNSRAIYKLRFAATKNPAVNFVDVGLDSGGVNELPFFVSVKNSDSSSDISFKVVANTKTNVLKVNLIVSETGRNKFKSSSDFTFQPSTLAVKIDTPAGALPLAQVLNDLGLGDSLNYFRGAEAGATGGSATTAKDTYRQVNIRTLQTQLERFYAQEGYYPTLAQMNSQAWRAQNMRSLDATALRDPDGTSDVLLASPMSHSFAYAPTDAAGKVCTNKCQLYTLTATLSTGKTFVKNALN